MAFMSVQLKVEDPLLTVPVLRSTDETLLYLQQHVEMAKKAKQHSLKPHLCNTIPRSTQSGLISGVGTQTGRAGRGRNCLTDQWDANPVRLGYNWKAMGSLDVLTEWCVVQKALVEIKAWEWKQDELQEWISSWELALAVHSCCASPGDLFASRISCSQLCHIHRSVTIWHKKMEVYHHTHTRHLMEPQDVF